MGSLVAQDWRDERIAQLEAELRARDARIGELEQQAAALKGQVAELLEKLGQNSQNSHRPPSTDSPADRNRRKDKAQGKGKGRRKRKRGAQPGHQGANRGLVPPEKVNKFVDLFPPHCENCWKALPEVRDPGAKRYQVIEIPPIQPDVTEFRRHEVECPCCRHKTRAAYDEAQIPASPFGSHAPTCRSTAPLNSYRSAGRRSVATSCSPRPRSLVHREPRTLEQQRKLAGRNGGTGGALGKGLQQAQPSTLEAASDQVQANLVAEQRTQLRVVALDEEHAVALIRVGAQQVRLAK